MPFNSRVNTRRKTRRADAFFRWIASFLVLALLAQEAAFAAPEVLEIVRIDSPSKNKPDLGIPESVAVLEDSYQAPGAGPKTFYLIQDAHTNASGQMNLSKTLESLLKKEKDLKLIFVEAGFEDSSLTFLRKHGTVQERRRIGESYLRRGLLHGEEYLDLVSEREFSLWGIEDPALYRRALADYRRVAKDRKKFVTYLKQIQNTLEILKTRLYNPSLLAFDALDQKVKKEKLALTDFLDFLASEAKTLGIDEGAYPGIRAFKNLKAVEESLDFKKASAEQALVIKSLSVKDQKEFFGMAEGATNPSKILPGDHPEQKGRYAYLGEKLKDNDSYPNFCRYLQYLKEAKALDAGGLLGEAKELKARILAELAQSSDEENLLRAQEAVDLLGKLLELKLTPEEYLDYESVMRDFGIRPLTGFLNQKIMELKAHYGRAVFLKDGLEGVLRRAEDFYRLTRRRDDYFIQESLKKMDAAGQAKAVLIAGGYHSANLKRLLEEKNISYVSIRPQVLHETNQARYEKILLGQKAFSASPAFGPPWATLRTPSALSVGRRVISDISGLSPKGPSTPLRTGGRLAGDLRYFIQSDAGSIADVIRVHLERLIKESSLEHLAKIIGKKVSITLPNGKQVFFYAHTLEKPEQMNGTPLLTRENIIQEWDRVQGPNFPSNVARYGVQTIPGGFLIKDIGLADSLTGSKKASPNGGARLAQKSQPDLDMRVFDVVFGTVALIVSSPLMALIAVAIKIMDGGPVIFKQDRAGFNGATFTIYKFETFGGGTRHPTRLGQWLRQKGLDELPQLWNVIKGDMSIYGPRPIMANVPVPPSYAKVRSRRPGLFSAHAADHSFGVGHGMTSEQLWETREENARYDAWERENWSAKYRVYLFYRMIITAIRSAFNLPISPVFLDSVNSQLDDGDKVSGARSSFRGGSSASGGRLAGDVSKTEADKIFVVNNQKELSRAIRVIAGQTYADWNYHFDSMGPIPEECYPILWPDPDNKDHAKESLNHIIRKLIARIQAMGSDPKAPIPWPLEVYKWIQGIHLRIPESSRAHDSSVSPAGTEKVASTPPSDAAELVAGPSPEVEANEPAPKRKRGRPSGKSKKSSALPKGAFAPPTGGARLAHRGLEGLTGGDLVAKEGKGYRVKNRVELTKVLKWMTNDDHLNKNYFFDYQDPFGTHYHILWSSDKDRLKHSIEEITRKLIEGVKEMDSVPRSPWPLEVYEWLGGIHLRILKSSHLDDSGAFSARTEKEALKPKGGGQIHKLADKPDEVAHILREKVSEEFNRLTPEKLNVILRRIFKDEAVLVDPDAALLVDYHDKGSHKYVFKVRVRQNNGVNREFAFVYKLNDVKKENNAREIRDLRRLSKISGQKLTPIFGATGDEADTDFWYAEEFIDGRTAFELMKSHLLSDRKRRAMVSTVLEIAKHLNGEAPMDLNPGNFIFPTKPDGSSSDQPIMVDLGYRRINLLLAPEMAKPYRLEDQKKHRVLFLAALTAQYGLKASGRPKDIVFKETVKKLGRDRGLAFLKDALSEGRQLGDKAVSKYLFTTSGNQFFYLADAVGKDDAVLRVAVDKFTVDFLNNLEQFVEKIESKNRSTKRTDSSPPPSGLSLPPPMGARLADYSPALTFILGVHEETGQNAGRLMLGSLPLRYRENRGGSLSIQVSKEPWRLIRRGQWEKTKSEDSNTLKINLPMGDFKAALDRAHEAAENIYFEQPPSFTDLSRRPVVAVLDLGGMNPQADGFEQGIIPILLEELRFARQRAWGRWAKFLLKGPEDLLRRITPLITEGRTFIVTDPKKLGENYINAPRILITTPGHFEEGARHFFIESVKDGSVPNFRSAILGALSLARVGELSTTNPDFVVVTKFLGDLFGHEINDTQQFIQVTTHPQDLDRGIIAKFYALPEIARLAVDQMAQGARLALRMAEQAA